MFFGFSVKNWHKLPCVTNFKRQIGRNNLGHITSKHRRKGMKAYYRLLNWNIPYRSICLGVISTSQYTGYIAIIKNNENNLLYWILAPYNLGFGSLFFNLKHSNHIKFIYKMLLNYFVRQLIREYISNSLIHAVSLNNQVTFALAAGSYCKLLVKNKLVDNSIILLPSKVRLSIFNNELATSGRVRNLKHKYIKITNAGQNFHKGKRPFVRGVAINPVDHPHGGKTSGGRIPVTPWGIYTKGFKTR